MAQNLSPSAEQNALRTQESSDTYPIRPAKLAHLGLYVRDLRRSVDFYEHVLGFKVSDWAPGAGEVFMRLDVAHATDHHVLALFTCAETDTPRQESDAGATRPGFAHMAFALEHFADLQNAAAFLDGRGLSYRGIQGGAGGHRRLYFHDPDGHTIELYCEMAQILPEGIVPPIPDERPLLFTPTLSVR